jgi:hypothetical protein
MAENGIGKTPTTGRVNNYHGHNGQTTENIEREYPVIGLVHNQKINFFYKNGVSGAIVKNTLSIQT